MDREKREIVAQLVRVLSSGSYGNDFSYMLSRAIDGILTVVNIAYDNEPMHRSVDRLAILRDMFDVMAGGVKLNRYTDDDVSMLFDLQDLVSKYGDKHSETRGKIASGEIAE
jgi:hypothetical protein